MENSIRKEFVHTININGNIANVFKAFCPIAERKWVPGWDCKMIHSESEIAEKNCVFTTKDDGMPEKIWVCSIYNPNCEVEYIRIIPDCLVSVINIKTVEKNKDTECTVKYSHTSLSTEGKNNILNNLNEEEFIIQIESWKGGISNFLKRINTFMK